jgi:uncharacterized membrane protein YqaE (UPF0057 family)
MNTCVKVLVVQVIGVWWTKKWACDSDVLINLLLCFVGLGACHGVHVLLNNA